ncbi:MAG: OmpH family outer membrane protein [Myxococcota bacterium]
MRQMMVCAALLLASAPAFAAKLCVVDFQTAVAETTEGKAAQKRLDGMYASKRGELERMQTELQKGINDLQSRRAILSADALAKEEQALGMKQAQFEQTYLQYQEEFQRTYMSMLGDLDSKMRAIAGETAKSSGCSIVLDKAAVVFQASDVTDISSALVARYNKTHPGR